MKYLKCIFLNIFLFFVFILGLEDDLSLFEFTKDGNVAQLSYSGIAIEKYGCPIVGIYISKLKISVLLSGLITYNKLMEPNDDEYDNNFSGREGVYVQDHSCLAVTGYHPDIIPVQNHINRIIQSHRYNYGEIPSMYNLATQSMEYITQGIYRDAAEEAASRPLAVSIIIASSKGIMISEPMSKINKYKYLCRGNFLNIDKSKIQKLQSKVTDMNLWNKNIEIDENDIVDEISNIITEIANVMLKKKNSNENENENDMMEDASSDTNINSRITSLRCAVVSACKTIDTRGSNEVDVIQLSGKDDLRDAQSTRTFIKAALTNAIKM